MKNSLVANFLENESIEALGFKSIDVIEKELELLTREIKKFLIYKT